MTTKEKPFQPEKIKELLTQLKGLVKLLTANKISSTTKFVKGLNNIKGTILIKHNIVKKVNDRYVWNTVKPTIDTAKQIAMYNREYWRGKDRNKIRPKKVAGTKLNKKDDIIPMMPDFENIKASIDENNANFNKTSNDIVAIKASLFDITTYLNGALNR